MIITDVEARVIASWYQSPGRNGTHLASLASTGAIYPELLAEIGRNIEDLCVGPDSAAHAGALTDLAAYVIAHGVRGPVDHWDSLDWSSARSAALERRYGYGRQ
jgi:hypothetical protein